MLFSGSISTISLLLTIQTPLIYATSILQKRPFQGPAQNPAVTNGWPTTDPICDPAFGSPRTGDCVYAQLAMENDTPQDPMTLYHGLQVQDGPPHVLSTPRVYSAGTCVITIYPLANSEADSAWKHQVRYAAGRIITKCVQTGIPKMGGLTIAGVNQKLYISIFDVPNLPRGPVNPAGAPIGAVNDPSVLTFLRNNCNWPPTAASESSNSAEEVRRANFRMLQNCNREVTAGNQPAAGGGVNDEQAAKLLREDILRDVGQRACLLDTGGGDDTGQGCGAGLACRALRWAGHVSEVLYGLANAGKSGGICELE